MKPMRPLGAWLSLLAVLGSFTLLGLDARAQTTDEIRVDKIGGVVELSTDGGSRWVRIQTNEVLRAGDRLRTGANSRAILRVSASTFLPFPELTEIEILPPDAPGMEPGLHIFRGLLSLFHKGKPGRIKILAPGAVAGVQGTEFVITVDSVNDKARTTLAVIDGEVSFGNGRETPLTLTNGERAVLEIGGAPVRIAGFVANNLLQWAFYYPAVLDSRDLAFSREEEQALRESLAAYREGDLLAALDTYGAREPNSEAERIYRAALLLAVGQVSQASDVLTQLGQGNASERGRRLSAALRQQIAAVKRETAANPEPELTTELLAASYYEQSRADGDETLNRALDLARRATTNSPQFGFAWARVAELEFSFSRTHRASDALDKSLSLSPRNAQALALKGFLLAAQNNPREATKWFDRAIATDAALANAWLGRGLCRIRRGDTAGGRDDLLIAAALEPRRAQLRSYLGKAYGVTGEQDRALHEFDLAKGLDSNDPTAWLYSALIKAEHNRANEAIRDLEHSQELNDNRSVYRSSLLLDQDRAARSANLALIYADAGLAEVAVWEAARAVTTDYGNYAAHLFLANSYAQTRSSSPYEQRLETPAYSEYLLASLLGPPDGRLLAQPLSQQEYSRLFERDTIGLSTSTEYQSHGAWSQYGVQYGTYRNTSYAVEGTYLWDPGQVKNREIESWQLSAKIKHQLTERVGLFFQYQEAWSESGDFRQTYDPQNYRADIHTRERQKPNILVGLDYRWSESHRTLILGSHVEDSFSYTNRHGPTFLASQSLGVDDGFFAVDLTQQLRDRFDVDSFEIQHIASAGRFQTIGGIRLQSITQHLVNGQEIFAGNSPGFESYFGQNGTVITNQSESVDSYRISPYLYEHWRVADSLTLIAGLSYDYQQQPENTVFAPISDEDRVQTQVSPKGALVWTPTRDSTVRAAYSRSLNGIDFDQSIRLEPAQLAGFAQAYKGVVPNSLGVGGVAGALSEAYDISIEQRFRPDTYVALAGQWLRSRAEHDVGLYHRDAFTASGPGEQTTQRFRFEERSVDVVVHQLLGDMFSAVVRYRLSDALLKVRYPDINPAFTSVLARKSEGLLHLVSISGTFRHPTGIFAGAGAKWWGQDLSESLSGVPDDSFWQLDVWAGYRFPRRRAEITVGLLNVTDQDYRLHPINLYPDLARERTFVARLQLNF